MEGLAEKNCGAGGGVFGTVITAIEKTESASRGRRVGGRRGEISNVASEAKVIKERQEEAYKGAGKEKTHL